MIWNACNLTGLFNLILQSYYAFFSLYCSKRECITGFWRGDLKEGDHLKDPGVDGRIILKLIFKKWDGGMYWIDMAQDRDR
jgi:hypothetical protein